MSERVGTIAEGDEPEEPLPDNSLGRLLALSDGVFAIAMTLLALDLRLLYSAFNLVANLALIRLLTDVQTRPLDAAAREMRERLWANVVVLLACIPGAFVLRGNGPWLLLLLIVSGRVPRLRRTRREARA